MNISERLFSSLAVYGEHNEVVGIDTVGFAQKLLLFDSCLLFSHYLDDIALLCGRIDTNALIELLDTGALEFTADNLIVADVHLIRSFFSPAAGSANSGPSMWPPWTWESGLTPLGRELSNKRLRPGEFSFGVSCLAEEESRIKAGVAKIASTSRLQKRQATRVAERVEGLLVHPDRATHSKIIFKGFYADLRGNSPSLRGLLLDRLARLNVAATGELRVSVESIAEEDFRVETNLQKDFGLSQEEESQYVSSALFRLIGVHNDLTFMNEMNVLSDLTEDRTQAIALRCDALIHQLTNQVSRKQQLTRVIRIAGLDGLAGDEGTADVDLRKIIEVRNSPELVEFKSWLRHTDDQTDEEIRSRVTSLRSRLGCNIQSTSGKFLRLALSTGLSKIPHFALPALALSAAEYFLLDKFLPKDSVVSILGSGYPSLFRR